LKQINSCLTSQKATKKQRVGGNLARTPERCATKVKDVIRKYCKIENIDIGTSKAKLAEALLDKLYGGEEHGTKCTKTEVDNTTGKG